MADAVIEAAVAALQTRGCEKNADELRDIHGRGLVHDLGAITEPLSTAVRDDIEDRLASELAEPSSNDDPNERVTPWLLQLQSVARDLRPFMEVDRAVHSQYYADRFNARNPT